MSPYTRIWTILTNLQLQQRSFNPINNLSLYTHLAWKIPEYKYLRKMYNSDIMVELIGYKIVNGSSLHFKIGRARWPITLRHKIFKPELEKRRLEFWPWLEVFISNIPLYCTGLTPYSVWLSSTHKSIVYGERV